MQLRPDGSVLLEAVAQFLLSELLPQVPDKALAFRIMIAANLANIAAGEMRALDDHHAAELARLQALLPGTPPAGEHRAALADLNRALSERLRSAPLSPGELAAIRAHVVQTAREELAVANPRFDTSDNIEGGTP